MTKPAHTMPPPDTAERRRALPVLTYSVEQLPSFDAAFYNRARAELSKVAELTVPPRDAKARRDTSSALSALRARKSATSTSGTRMT
jgi:hypothetical protein